MDTLVYMKKRNLHVHSKNGELIDGLLLDFVRCRVPADRLRDQIYFMDERFLILLLPHNSSTNALTKKLQVDCGG